MSISTRKVPGPFVVLLLVLVVGIPSPASSTTTTTTTTTRHSIRRFSGWLNIRINLKSFEQARELEGADSELSATRDNLLPLSDWPAGNFSYRRRTGSAVVVFSSPGFMSTLFTIGYKLETVTVCVTDATTSTSTTCTTRKVLLVFLHFNLTACNRTTVSATL
eukprot:1247218-Rhodomonas_salina.3